MDGFYHGIIPACAGSTSPVRATDPCRRDHPRMRGEHELARPLVVKLQGSSPHARGARFDALRLALVVGIIPACAGSTTTGARNPRPRRDHPRMRGEHDSSIESTHVQPGSSPHARGARLASKRRVHCLGIIPACAGSTCACLRRCGCSWDHPRMRGEHMVELGIFEELPGSSPHARGALYRHRPLRDEPGIIPACAGSTDRDRGRRAARRDHPRMRGEHEHKTKRTKERAGSSPHARGAPSSTSILTGGSGIIPACAGSTSWALTVSRLSRDHPRMRGEHSQLRASSSSSSGSSPHARGARPRCSARAGTKGIIPACAGSTPRHTARVTKAQDHPRMRGEHWLFSDAVTHRQWIIPACAGSTMKSKLRPSKSRDHPRMRGEHIVGLRLFVHHVGSSPHARGAHRLELQNLAGLGIIPACAGSTANTGSSGTAAWDHPRMRGEHDRTGEAYPDHEGSSPHARGARAVRFHPLSVRGIIPACAGSTHLVHVETPFDKDHPRMRGEHLGSGFVKLLRQGSSPHARGARLVALAAAAGPGIIPACAGSTRHNNATASADGDHPRMRGEHINLPAPTSPKIPFLN